MSIDEDLVQEGISLSHIASKMPTPPPRPASISSARSSKRSSSTVSQSRQVRLQSVGDGDNSEAPPTPSLSCVYNGRPVKDDESQPPASSLNTSLSGETRRALSSPNTTKASRNRTLSFTATSLATKKRGLGMLKEGKTDEDGNYHAKKGMSRSSNVRMRYISEQKAEKLQQALYTSADLALDMIEASYLIASVTLSPIYQRALTLLQSCQPPKELQTSPQDHSVKTEAKEDVSQLSTSFAQRFKTIICSSHLLAKSLDLSHYDQEARSSKLSKMRCRASSVPISTFLSDPVKLECKESTTDFMAASLLLFDAAVVASMMLAPICKDGNAWTRSTVLLISFVWSFFFLTDVSQIDAVEFELTHGSSGFYSLRKKDLEDEEGKDSEYLSSDRAIGLSEKMCEVAQDLVYSCQAFDIECNKSIALVQEVELVSRGFKLTRPFPPISRIEATEASMSPTRNRSFTPIPPQNASAVAGATSRLSRSSSSGGSSVSGWKHLGPRPQSMLLSQTNIADGRTSPQIAEHDMRLASLRKNLAASFDGAKTVLQKAIEDVKSLVDEKELLLIEEMYDVHQISTQDSALSPTSEKHPAIPHSASAERSASSTSMGRGKNENEVLSSTDDDSACQPMTPQIDYFPSQEIHSTGLYGKTRRRDSSVSEAWSATSPMRETPPPIRAGSRLGYISDKTSTGNTTPNQTAASKRLSYIASATTACVNPIMQPRSSHVKTSSASMAGQAYRKRFSLLNSNALDEHKETEVVQSNSHSSHPLLIASLKAFFDNVHTLRRRFLCHLLALDITLKRKAVIAQSLGEMRLSMVQYWSTVEDAMKQVESSMSRMASVTKALLEKEADGPMREENDAAGTVSQGMVNESYPGIEERLAGMGQALRSIQVKMRACSEELHLKLAPALHGPERLPISSMQADNPERVLEAVREDLLTLSAEWESALKILQLAQQQQQIVRPPSANADVTSSTLTSSRLDSPQEADEDAMRQWVPPDGLIGNAVEGNDEQLAHLQTEHGLQQWSSNGDKDMSGKAADLSELLVKSASPDHLPPPGLEQVYESMSQVAEKKMQRSIMSREERIRMTKEQRVARERAIVDDNTKDPSAGMIQELQAVMKSRQNRPDEMTLKEQQQNNDAQHIRMREPRPRIDSQRQLPHYDTNKQSSTDSTAGFAF